MASCPVPPDEIQRLQSVLHAVRMKERVEMTGLWGSSAALVLSEWIRLHDPLVLIVARNEREALALKEDLEFFLKENVPFYPAAELVTPSDREGRAILSERLALITRVRSPDPPRCIVTPASGLLAPVPRKEELEVHTLSFEKGWIVNRQRLRDDLSKAGFRSTPMVTAPAEFSIRGDIIDLFPMALTRPLRIELYDERIESIREIDLETQLSVSRLESAVVPLPSIEGKEHWTILPEHLPENHALVLLEPHNVVERMKIQAREFGATEAALCAAFSWLEQRGGVDVHRVSTENPESHHYKVQQAQGLGRMLKDIRPSIEGLLARSGMLHVLCQAEAEAERLREVMEEQGIRPDGRVRLVLGRLDKGFILPAWNLGYINHHELLLRLPVRRERKVRKIKARALESFNELKPGDLVVHLVHGIARYDGITRMEREGGQEDFLKLTFSEDTLLYVPASKIHLVEKYIGGEGHKPALDRLGGKGFTRRKERVEAALRDVAAELLDLQAVREEERGVAFGPDDELQTLFDASFPYEDTEDQESAMQEIKNDMEKAKPMDRLLCGDVGFGKTELAIRAAFKAVSWGKQVALLVPTTLLAQQHFETFRTRLQDYPVSVEVLSRFKSKAEQKEIVEAAAAGRLDILIGTHRLLSGDVRFKDLGLLVIDEEQRFGVMHKERLKRLKRTVDVLTMTATPIPRTLHMALVGLRDISNLEIPPEGRMPIDTHVVYKDAGVIKRALLAEVNRGGQVFYLHNRVETIDRETGMLQRLAPSARIARAHGQMRERDLERIMFQFIHGEIDVLVCTTIIESGIDLPGVNSMLIDRADAFGLADLHQLRGRVGRGHVKARAYLLIPRKPLPDVALRRLKAIEELSHLGAGFQIALKDLEIRGAGNILGAEQHGHIAAVGYELYCRLLKQTILMLKGEREEEDQEDVDLDIRVDAYLPSGYIPDEGLRMEILRRLSRIRDREGLREITKELEDRFGRPPLPARNLLDVCLVRAMMVRCGIKKIACASGQGHFVVEIFHEGRFAGHTPFDPKQMRYPDPRKGLLLLPRHVRTPRDMLKFLKTGLLAVDGGV